MVNLPTYEENKETIQQQEEERGKHLAKVFYDFLVNEKGFHPLAIPNLWKDVGFDYSHKWTTITTRDPRECKVPDLMLVAKFLEMHPWEVCERFSMAHKTIKFDHMVKLCKDYDPGFDLAIYKISA